MAITVCCVSNWWLQFLINLLLKTYDFHNLLFKVKVLFLKQNGGILWSDLWYVHSLERFNCMECILYHDIQSVIFPTHVLLVNKHEPNNILMYNTIQNNRNKNNIVSFYFFLVSDMCLTTIPLYKTADIFFIYTYGNEHHQLIDKIPYEN